MRLWSLDQGWSNPGSYVLLFSFTLYIGWVVCDGLNLVDERDFILLAAVVLVVLGVGIGVRRWVGLQPRAERLASAAWDGDAVLPGALLALMHAIESDALPERTPGTEWQHYRAVSVEEVDREPKVWTGAPILVSGSITQRGPITPLSEGWNLRSIELADESGNEVNVLLPFQAGDDIACPSLALAGRIATRVKPDRYRLALLADDWVCSDARLMSDKSVGANPWNGKMTLVRRFESPQTKSQLEAVVLAYKGYLGGQYNVLAIDDVDWAIGGVGAAILVTPTPDNADPGVCDRLTASAVGNVTCEKFSDVGLPEFFTPTVGA